MNETVYFSVLMALSAAVPVFVVKRGWVKPPSPKQQFQTRWLIGLLACLSYLLIYVV
ncbi:hypothetical protein [Conchiformibius kuhniae]|uniref:Uncharacterized protein n=1 Tax=Conchiformibius kuhniae TaxID=211502 RepID=A0A8T9MWS5_9NEIS|nr:hypothetical protein [Conchiformibius kuhniae]UOP05591.1 hypothetical protein LVJ77_05720 [Conchiformibius kuhniae]